MMRDLIAVVTGGGSGIGAALCTTLARRGARVIAADIDGHAAAEVCTGIRIGGGTAAHAIVRGIAANRAVIPVTAEAHAAWWLNRLSPSLAATISHQLAAFAHRLSGSAQRR
jgi:NAD(P)-dependent dehydrogenase (short-subunit alcohol dehydrogenase family)